MTYEDAITAEVERWPGATVRFEPGGKHLKAVLRYKDSELFVVYPASGSDSKRGVLNCIPDVKRTLTQLGARRDAPRKATGPKRKINPGADLREVKKPEAAPVMPNPWDALRDIKIAAPESVAEPVRLSFWARLKQIFVGRP